MSRLVVGGVIAALVVAAGCTSPSGPGGEAPVPESAASVGAPPMLRWTNCPQDVTVTFVSRHRCGWLTVLADRDEPEGSTLDLLVVKFWPIGMDAGKAVGTGFGHNIGEPVAVSGDHAAGATRLGRIGVEIEPRGTGPHNEVRLRCPEVYDLRHRIARSTSEEGGDLFVRGVRRCAELLRGEGLDPADFGVTEAAADLEDLRVVLGIESWAVSGSYGSTSLVAAAYIDRNPGRLTRLVLDSPSLPGTDDLTAGALGLREGLSRLFEACALAVRCHQFYPDLRATWRRALARVTRAPLTGIHRTHSGELIDLLVDAPKLVRVARFALGGDGPAYVERLPAMLHAAARGRLHPDLAEVVATDPDLCFGYRPKCRGHDQFSLGVYLTALCGDQRATRVQPRIEDAAGDDPLLREVFAESPYLAACEAWDVPAAVATRAKTLPAGLDVLMLSGELTSFAAPELIESWAGRLPGRARHVVVPGATHNTLGVDCVRQVRARWLTDPRGRLGPVCPDQEPRWAAPR